MTRDPIGYAGGINLYAYTGNNPVNERDPSGLLSKAECALKYEKLQSIMYNLQRTIDNYDPATDPIPHPIYRNIGGKSVFLGMTKPGSHYRNILKYQKDLRNATIEYGQKCRDNNKDGNAKIPAGVNPLLLYAPAPNVEPTPIPRTYPRFQMERHGDYSVCVSGSLVIGGSGSPVTVSDPDPIIEGFGEFAFP